MTQSMTFHRPTEGEFRQSLVPSKVTKTAQHKFIRHMLSTNDNWAKAALLKIYEFQTDAEQSYQKTIEHNNVGFSGNESEILSSLAEQLKTKGWLSPKQMKIVFKRIPRYSRQIIQISNKNKLNYQVIEFTKKSKT